jgi:hypothetical protein
MAMNNQRLKQKTNLLKCRERRFFIAGCTPETIDVESGGVDVSSRMQSQKP